MSTADQRMRIRALMYELALPLHNISKDLLLYVEAAGITRVRGMGLCLVTEFLGALTDDEASALIRELETGEGVT